MKKLELQKCIVGSVSTNCYLLKNKETGEMLIIDPGDNAGKIEQKILEMQGKPMAILLTHGHFDHILAAEEIKKKYKSVVYKRRLQLPEEKVMDSFQTGEPLPVHSQIGNEIQYFRDYYENLHPSVFLSYEREAYYSLDGSDFRVTFDENILYRRNDFSLGSEIYGFSLLGNDQTLMEIKTSGGIPLWMSEILTKQHLYKTSFSKYGSAYQRMLAESLQGGYSNV